MNARRQPPATAVFLALSLGAAASPFDAAAETTPSAMTLPVTPAPAGARAMKECGPGAPGAAPDLAETLGLDSLGAVPTRIGDQVAIEGGVRGRHARLSGAEINSRAELGIWLKEERLYDVFSIGDEFSMTITDPSGSGESRTLALGLPAAGKILLIVDPTDPFYYVDADVPLVGSFVEGRSLQGLIPFVPARPFEALDMFDGHRLLKGSVSLGVKALDLVQIEGVQVVHQPQFHHIDFGDAFNSPVAYKMGVNGTATFGMSIGGVGDFPFELGEMSATLDVGFQRQHLAMHGKIEPDVSWIPEWMPLVPQNCLDARWTVDGSGDFEARIEGRYGTRLPQAAINGTFAMSPEGVSLEGRVGSPEDGLLVSLEFRDRATTARIGVESSLTDDIDERVLDAFDRELAELEAALAAYEAAAEDYQIEVSLRGLRKVLPGVIDRAIGIANGVPGRVQGIVRSEVIRWIKDRWYIDWVADERAIGARAGRTARGQAWATVRPIIAELSKLKTELAKPDDAAARAALKTALDRVYAYRNFSRKIKVRTRIAGKTYTVYSRRISYPVLSAAQARQVKAAADNVHRIQATSERMISSRAVIDALPKEQALRDARERVASGLATLPSVAAVGYTLVAGDAGREDEYGAFVELDGTRHPVEFNVLDPTALAEGIAALMAYSLL